MRNTVLGHPPWPVIAKVTCISAASTSGRSSRSTLTGTTLALTTSATSGSLKDSSAITWHQWQLE
ncbi:hypothetical protein JCM18916_1579 [Cutibacterium acnes JCM 18916]|nr:hypothetical protein JCM18916_1579 [Cutibacterium acnes JCM 18916]